jgi:Uri superfamily endonuclease
MRALLTPACSKQPGTYALLLTLEGGATVQIGRLGTFGFPAGRYIYVGSALGSGGLRARLLRHCRTEKRLHWHIDYLLRCATVCSAWCVESPSRLECTWARWLQGQSAVWIPAPHFGASDCRCPSHLYALASACDYEHLMEGIQGTDSAQVRASVLDICGNLLLCRDSH